MHFSQFKHKPVTVFYDFFCIIKPSGKQILDPPHKNIENFSSTQKPGWNRRDKVPASPH